MNLCDQKQVKNLMSAFGLSFRKEFGQNFLIDAGVVGDIADSAGDSAERTVLEIGPGIGTLTRELAARYRNVVALEIDRGLIPVLSHTLSDFPNARVINEDVMKTDLGELLRDDFEKGPVSVCANLPYYITTPILIKLLESKLPFESITVMVQKEVADRLSAKPGSKDYGSITVLLAYYGKAAKLFTVPAGKFLPPPSVESAVVRIDLHRESPFGEVNEDFFFRTLRAAFGQRRKTLQNALSSGFPTLTKAEIAEVLASLGFPPDIRGERLSVDDFVALSRALERASKTTD